MEYGNPSGHSWFAVVFGFSVLIDYWGRGKNFSNIIISLLAVILMPLSRMYLGAHSLNQVLEGLSFGLAMCLLYIFGLKKMITMFLNEFPMTTKSKVIILVVHVLYILAFLMHTR